MPGRSGLRRWSFESKLARVVGLSIHYVPVPSFLCLLFHICIPSFPVPVFMCSCPVYTVEKLCNEGSIQGRN